MRTRAAAVGVLLLLGAVGCSPDRVDAAPARPEVTATPRVLDPVGLRLPLEEYQFSDAQWARVTSAQQILATRA
ncbi:hypothetical protein ABZ250_34955 [Streptomyces afghaniensis]|uniref:hypothetical protein n=1 Tax=Streptomyces afghaniensis TaxID=66865 RepID=UPI0033B4927C